MHHYTSIIAITHRFAQKFNNLYSLFVGMASLFGTVFFAVARLLIVMKRDNLNFEASSLSLHRSWQVQLIWPLALSFSLLPLFGIGRYDTDMVSVR